MSKFSGVTLFFFLITLGVALQFYVFKLEVDFAVMVYGYVIIRGSDVIACQFVGD